MNRFFSFEESSGKNNYDRYMKSISCGHELILYGCTMPMFMLWIGNAKGYINEVKLV